MPRAFGGDERVAAKNDGHVMVPPGKASSFEVIEPEFAFEVFVDSLGAPSLHDDSDVLQQGNIADADLVATTDYGTTGATNLTPGKPITLTFTLGSKEVATSDVTPKAGWLTYTHVFPIRKAK